MALRAFRPCKQAGCIQLTRDANGYCTDHIHAAQETHSEYKRNRTDKREQAFYHSGAWIKIRAMVMSRDHGLCQQCMVDGRVTLADVVHHRVEIKANWLLRLVLSNLVPLCNGCHQRVHRGKG